MVLDEADEMLKMGFVQDVEKIIESADPNRQLVMFSATTNQDVLTVSWKYQHDPIEIVVQAEAENKPNITQYIIESDQKQKYEHLLYLLDSDQYKRVMIFCNTKDMTARLCDRLKKAGYQAECLHGDVRQSFRDKVMSGFRKGEFEILVATDVAARGIDVDDVEAVFNYDLPDKQEFYVHRIGRTGRAKRAGVSFSFVSFRDSIRMDEILKYIDSKPISLVFDDFGTLCYKEDGTPFLENAKNRRQRQREKPLTPLFSSRVKYSLSVIGEWSSSRSWPPFASTRRTCGRFSSRARARSRASAEP